MRRSGNRPGSQCGASVAGKASRNGARWLAETSRPAFDECCGDAPSLALAGVQDCRDVAARQLAAEEDGFQHRFGAVRKRAGACGAAGPRQDAVPQTVGLDEPLQEVYLVEADLQKETG